VRWEIYFLLQFKSKKFLIFTASKDDLDNGMFVRVCSWDENKNHEDFKKFVGRRIKITIETID